MRLRTVPLFAAVGLAFAMLTPAAGQATVADSLQNTPAIYFSPHQDDETLSMGADIAQTAEEGRPIIIVLVTDGGASGARANMCHKANQCLTLAQFKAARTREFKAAVKHLAPHAQLFFEHERDAHLTYAQAKSIIDKFHNAYPNASFKTMSWHDQNPDHANLGKALRDTTSIQDARFFQNHLYWTSDPVDGFYSHGGERMRMACNSYKYVHLATGRYGIGWNWSVPPAFKWEHKHKLNKIHTRAGG